MTEIMCLRWTVVVLAFLVVVLLIWLWGLLLTHAETKDLLAFRTASRDAAQASVSTLKERVRRLARALRDVTREDGAVEDDDD